MMFGVWLYKQGWLKNNKGTFAANEREIAEAAASFFQRARVLPIDESMRDFEDIFIEQDKGRRAWHTWTR